MMATWQQMKQLGLELVSSHNTAWTVRTIYRLREFCAARKAAGSPEFRFEEFVEALKVEKWECPTSSNVYGSLPRIAIKAGMIEFTDRYENAKSSRTRCHPVKIWRAL